jgi:hypothetical protein
MPDQQVYRVWDCPTMGYPTVGYLTTTRTFPTIYPSGCRDWIEEYDYGHSTL